MNDAYDKGRPTMDNPTFTDDEPKINLDAVPEHVADYIASGMLKVVREFLKRPNGKEIIEARCKA